MCVCRGSFSFEKLNFWIRPLFLAGISVGVVTQLITLTLVGLFTQITRQFLKQFFKFVGKFT
jgi:hypothetical protein